MQMTRRRRIRRGQQSPQGRVCQPSDRFNLSDDCRHVLSSRSLERIDEIPRPPSIERVIGTPGESSEDGKDDEHSLAIKCPGRPQQLLAVFINAPRSAAGKQQDVQPFEQRRETAAAWICVPQVDAVGQEQLGPATARLLLLPGEPFLQRRHQVIVGQVIVPPCGSRIAGAGALLSFEPRRVGRRDQTELGVQDVQERVKIPGMRLVTRDRQKLAVGPHRAFEIAALM